MVDGYNLAFAALVLAAGSLSDRYGRRPPLLLGLLGFAATSLAGALVDSTGALILARLGMGVFAALIFPTTLSIISNTFRERQQRAAALGGWGAVVGVGVASGPGPAGCCWSTSTGAASSWRSSRSHWWLSSSGSCWCPSRVTRRCRGSIYAAWWVSIGFLGLLTDTVIEGPERGWDSTATLLGFAGSSTSVSIISKVRTYWY